MKPERFLDLITAMKCICSLMCFGITSLLQDLQHDNTLRSELITTQMSLYVLMKCNLITYNFLPECKYREAFLEQIPTFSSLSSQQRCKHHLYICRIRVTKSPGKNGPLSFSVPFNSLKLSSFFSKFEPFSFGVRFLGHFCTYFSFLQSDF